jgi:multidrug efflux pump subunit AcrA (membrane-fusion protein)
MLAIIPLMESNRISADPVKPDDQSKSPLGALIVEQLKDSRITPALEKRTEIVVEHGETALTNAAEHNRIFLMPVWKAIGKITSAFAAGNRTKTFWCLAAVAAVVAFLALFPYSFGLGAKGSLIPESQQVVFAQTDGTMEAIYVSDDGDTMVTAGQPLALMKNSDIELAIGEITGQIAEKQQEISSNRRLQSQGGLTPLERNELEGQTLQAMQTVKSLQNELAIRQLEQTLLEIKSPIDGRVVNWNVRQNLLHRPVVRGQSLMTIVHPDTKWRIELEMPERRLIHLIRAMKHSQQPLKVTFGLVSHPGTEYEGQLISVDQKLDVHSDEGNTALVRVAFPNEMIDPELLRAETRVTAKVQCGTRSIGYVMFHELFETVQSSLMFWF